jgi:hypothetical protein
MTDRAIATAGKEVRCSMATKKAAAKKPAKKKK